MSWALERVFSRRSSRAAAWLAGCLLQLACAAPAAGQPEYLIGKPVVGRNADGYLEVFKVDADGQVQHRWQKQSNGDWSSWSSLGGAFSPGIAVVAGHEGRLQVFAVDRASGHLWHARQSTTNSVDWTDWQNLGGTLQPPLAAVLHLDGRLEVFALEAQRGGILHIWETHPGGDWSAWSSMGSGPFSGLAVAQNLDGRLEIFALNTRARTLAHCWQRRPSVEGDWSNWVPLAGPVSPGFVVGRNVLGRLELFSVNPTNGSVQRSWQAAPGASEQWSRWQDFGGDLQPQLALGQSADGRLELLGLTRGAGEVVHRWEDLTDGSDVWSLWTGMGQSGQATLAVERNEDGNLEVFAQDIADPNRVNHRRQISRASDWLDWSTLDTTTLEYNSRTWQTDEGLPHNVVQALAQTRDGYLWVGTSAGLARFDGSTFVTFDSMNTPELKNSSITALCAEPEGGLWIGTEGAGLVRLENARFTRFTTADGLAGDSLRVIYRSRDGVLWFGTATGMSRYQNGSFTNFTKKQGLSSDIVRAISEDRDGALWIATGEGLNRLHAGTMESFVMPNGLPNDSARAVCQDRGGRIWIGSNNGMLWYSSFWTNFYAYNSRYGLSDTFVSAICEDREGNLWVGTYSGLNRFHQGRFFSELNNEGAPFDRVNALFEDREGDLWVGSREGLARLTPKRFVTYTKRQGLSHNNVMSVLEDRAGSLWLGTWGGGLDQLKNERVTAYALTNAFAQGLVLSLCETRDGSLWFGADFDGGLTQLKDGEFTHYSAQNGLINAPVRVLREDRSGVLWIGTGLGLCRFSDGKFTRASGNDHSSGDGVHAICEDHMGRLWVGTDAGLSCWQRGVLTNAWPLGPVLALYEDPAHDLWMGTADAGLKRLRQGHFDACTTQHGLFSNEVFEMLEDNQGWLWMTCSKGVFRVRKTDLNELFDGKRQTVTSIEYGKSDGLESTQCSGSAKPGAWKSRDGRLWFPTTKGLASVDPNTAKINTNPPPVYIDQLFADRKPVRLDSSKIPGLSNPGALSETGAGTVEIPPGRGELEFHYTALSLQNPEGCRFKYRLVGVDSEWRDAETRRAAHYNNIYPGSYSFRVIACNKDGVWNEAGNSLAIHLRPRLWQTWWWRTAVALFVIGAAGGSARYVTRRRMQRKLELLEQRHAIEKERGRIAKDIHDDLGSSLTRIMMLGERAEEGLSKHEEVGLHVNKIVTSARRTVQALDEIVWAVNPENDTVEGLVEYLSHYADEFFENTPMSCRLEIPVQLPAWTLPAETRHDLFLVVKEAFHNVLKHSQAGQVRIEVSTSGTTLGITVEDNGCGFDPGHFDSGRKGNGLGNMRMRIQTLGGQLSLKTAPGQGTRINLTVPLPKQSLS